MSTIDPSILSFEKTATMTAAASFIQRLGL